MQQQAAIDEEQYCQISSKFDLKRRSPIGFSEERRPKKNKHKKDNKMSSNMGSVSDAKICRYAISQHVTGALRVKVILGY